MAHPGLNLFFSSHILRFVKKDVKPSPCIFVFTIHTIIGHLFPPAAATLLQYKHELRTVSVSDQLTPETLMSRLQAERVAPPLLLHHSLREVSVSSLRPHLPVSSPHLPLSPPLAPLLPFVPAVP